jgi:hypothetical protein
VPHYFLAVHSDAERTPMSAERQGESVVESDGPYAAGPRRIAGFWILDAPDAETARAWAIEASAACNEPVELRAFL